MAGCCISYNYRCNLLLSGITAGQFLFNGTGGMKVFGRQ